MKNLMICLFGVSIVFLMGMAVGHGWNTGGGKVWTDRKVGIGVSNPISKLDVKGSQSDVVFVHNKKNTGAVSGIQAWTKSTRGIGIFGVATSNRGPNAGVQGTTDSLSRGFGVFSVGDSGASGAKLFRIDHPLDPANTYLNHFSIEAPRPFNMYRGTVVLNENGEAPVLLPEYFDSINQDFQYQLTPIGGPAPNLYVAAEIENNAFWIAGGTPGVSVSWTVTALRSDPYMQRYGKPTIEDKAEARGTYLHPELYGQPKTRSLQHTVLRSETTEVGLNE